MATVRRVQRSDDEDDGQNGDLAQVRRNADPLALSLHSLAEAGVKNELRPFRDHKSKGDMFSVSSELMIGIEQRISLTWLVHEKYMSKDVRVLGFRSTDGFGRIGPKGELWYGTKIIDDSKAGMKEDVLTEGEYFYTFLLVGPKLFGLTEGVYARIQFSEIIPSAKHAIARLEETLAAQKLVHRLLQQSNEIRSTATGADMAPGSSAGQRMAQHLARQQAEIEALKSSPVWRTLSKARRRAALGAIMERYEELGE